MTQKNEKLILLRASVFNWGTLQGTSEVGVILNQSLKSRYRLGLYANDDKWVLLDYVYSRVNPKTNE